MKIAGSVFYIMEAVPSTSTSVSDNCNKDLCFISYLLFGRTISSDFNISFKYCQDHNLILSEKVCLNCGNKCRIDHNKHAF